MAVFRRLIKLIVQPIYSVGVFAGMMLSAHTLATSVVTFSPTGEVEKPSQIRITFSEDMTALGNSQQKAPVNWQCSHRQLKGNGHWINSKTWVFDIDETRFNANESCTFKVVAKDLKGQPVTGTIAYQFNTGPVRVIDRWPSGDIIEDDQAFAFKVNGSLKKPADTSQFYCLIDQSPEKIPFKPLPNEESLALIKHLDRVKETDSIITGSCGRRLPAGAQVKVVHVRQAPKEPDVFEYNVRKPFTVEFTCLRDNATLPCSPEGRLRLIFEGYVPLAQAKKIRLIGPDGFKRSPAIDQETLTDSSAVLDVINFVGPFPEQSELKIELPSELVDDVNRPLLNAKQFPLTVKTAASSPLVKFPASSFGIIEAENASMGPAGVLPITVRRVESSAHLQGKKLQVTDIKDLIHWYNKLDQYENSWIDDPDDPKKMIETRTVSIFDREPFQPQTFKLPKLSLKSGLAEFQVLGIPLSQRGFHIVEMRSNRLGEGLLGKKAPMFVRTGALVTNLAVHFKYSRYNAGVWVTSLDKGQPVPNAKVTIYNCAGETLWQGQTQDNGVAQIAKALPWTTCDKGRFSSGYWVSAEVGSGKNYDFSFVLSSWNSGFEAWRFPFPTDTNPVAREVVGHAVLDRTLLRAGETVSMKHFLRSRTQQGFRYLKDNELPELIRIVHDGSGEEVIQSIQWVKTPHTQYASTKFSIPKDAKLGEYSVYVHRNGIRGTSLDVTKPQASYDDRPRDLSLDGYDQQVATFRVEEFRLPVMKGWITSQVKKLISINKLPIDVAMVWGNGGAAKSWPITVTAQLKSQYGQPSGYEEFSFAAPTDPDPDKVTNSLDGKILLNKHKMVLSEQGTGTVVISDIPDLDRPYQLLSEVQYTDPNGEIQTFSREFTLWPGFLQIGIHSKEWVAVGQNSTVKVVVLDTDGNPVIGQKVKVKAETNRVISTRKKIVGGFYAWEHHDEKSDIGEVCQGVTNFAGLVFCDVKMTTGGEVRLTAITEDKNGKTAQSQSSIWVRSADDFWFEQTDSDRIDIVPEKPHYSAGETARFQVRMPFREATVWLAIEQGGIIETRVMTLKGNHPVIELKVDEKWSPNVYVSVLAVRGRVKDVPWYSFFTWGWREPSAWWQAYQQSKQETEVTATVDLAKPAFKYGVTKIDVLDKAGTLAVDVKVDKKQYDIRDDVAVDVTVRLPNGRPASGRQVAIAVVDEALLELRPNTTWDLYSAMHGTYPYGVETATAQMQVVGKRHYGRKALAVGGDGGKSQTRELLETLLYWQSDVLLDEHGHATVKFKTNDALSRFRVVVIADSGPNWFGKGEASFNVSQDLQIVSGLPLLVREGDIVFSSVMIRNSSSRLMNITVNAKNGMTVPLPSQTIKLAPGGAETVTWKIRVPENQGGQMKWEFSAVEQNGKSKDALTVTQLVLNPIPVTVEQSTLQRLTTDLAVPIAMPKGAIAARSGVKVYLRDKIGSDLPAVRKWFVQYPYVCLEQRTSVALGLEDDKRWEAVINDLPKYIGNDNLAHFYPIGESKNEPGSDFLTSYILAVSQEAGKSLPEDLRNQLLNGLRSFVTGKRRIESLGGANDRDSRILKAISVLSRYQMFDPKWLDVIRVTPEKWSTSMLIDWLGLLVRESSIPNRSQQLQHVEQLLRSRMTYSGTKLVFTSESNDNEWWLMSSPNSNAAQLLLITSRLANWQNDIPRLFLGLMSRQEKGTWQTTTANLWGVLAAKRFSAQFENQTVGGTTILHWLGKATALAWDKAKDGGLSSPLFSWGQSVMPVSSDSPKVNPAQVAPPPAGVPKPVDSASIDTGVSTKPYDGLKLRHQGSGVPWAIIQVEAAIRHSAARFAGYSISKQWVPEQQKMVGQYHVGDIYRVIIRVKAQADRTQVVINDPIPAGATILGSGLGRESRVDVAAGEPDQTTAYPAYVERKSSGYRAYFNSLDRGEHVIEYKIRLNSAGEFQMPPTRVEAMYDPDVFGMLPNALIKVLP